jgi:hypothetical protein
MGGHKSISGTSFEQPVPPIPPVEPDYIVTGNPNPDCKGNYFENGVYNEFPVYTRDDDAYNIWFEIDAGYTISPLVGLPLSTAWYNLDTDPTAAYTQHVGTTGTPIVTAG